LSTVLWANVLANGKVQSDEDDHAALYKHADKLDALTKALGTPSFQAICDTTDLRFNTDEDLELPPGMQSTNELMAAQGAWMPLADAVSMLRTLRDHVVGKKVRFGLLGNDHDQVVAELEDVLAFLSRQQASDDRKFNFSVVM